MVKDISRAGQFRSAYLTNVGGTLVLFGQRRHARLELWKSDGTAAGTVIVKDIVPGGGSFVPRATSHVNGTLFFSR